MPFYSDMNLLEEIINELLRWRKNTATAHLKPVTLRATVSRALNSLKNKGFEDLALWILYLVLPILLFPPSVPLIVID